MVMMIKFVCPICKAETVPRPKGKATFIRMYCKCGNHMKEVEVNDPNSPGEGFRRGGYLGDAID